MECKTKSYLLATAPKISAGSLKIWSLLLRNTPFPTAFIAGTLSLEGLLFKTWRTACITAVKCWLFCRTTTSPATSAGKSCTWPYRGSQTRATRHWFLCLSTSWRKSSCHVRWQKRIAGFWEAPEEARLGEEIGKRFTRHRKQYLCLDTAKKSHGLSHKKGAQKNINASLDYRVKLRFAFTRTSLLFMRNFLVFSLSRTETKFRTLNKLKIVFGDTVL